MIREYQKELEDLGKGIVTAGQRIIDISSSIAVDENEKAVNIEQTKQCLDNIMEVVTDLKKEL